MGWPRAFMANWEYMNSQLPYCVYVFLLHWFVNLLMSGDIWGFVFIGGIQRPIFDSLRPSDYGIS